MPKIYKPKRITIKHIKYPDAIFASGYLLMITAKLENIKQKDAYICGLSDMFQ